MRIAVLGAGGPAGVNVCRALHEAGHSVVGLDGNQNHLPWADSYCDQTIVAPPFGTAALDNLFDHLDVDLVHTQPEQGLLWLAARSLPSFLPSMDVLHNCQNKNSTGTIWGHIGLREHSPHRVFDPYPDMLHLAKDDLGLPFWLRASSGAGAKGATLVEDLRTAFHWIRYWETRGVRTEWIAEEYLPGRDYCWTGLYHQGLFVAGFARERLEWIYPHLAPSGRTGTPTIAVTVHDERVNECARAAVYAVGGLHGIFCVDMREDRDGVVRPTEINAGRFATTSPLYSQIGPNMADLYAQLSQPGAMADPTLGDDIYPENIALLRHIDCGHVFCRYDRETGTMGELLTAAR